MAVTASEARKLFPTHGAAQARPSRRLVARIDDEHRLVYLVDGADIVILQARFHYG
jgi:toxin YoeB